MSTKKSRIRSFFLLFVSIAIGAFLFWFLFFPDFFSGRTRINAVIRYFNYDVSFRKTFGVVEKVESIRRRFEIGKAASLAVVAQRDEAISELMAEINDQNELLCYLHVYGESMYLSTESTGTYQVVFFSTLRKLAQLSINDPKLKEELILLKPKLSLMEMDSGEYDAIIDLKPFP